MANDELSIARFKTVNGKRYVATRVNEKMTEVEEARFQNRKR